VNSSCVWKPHVTVAAVVRDGDRYLMVEEQTSRGIAFNQPAGHLEPDEDLIEATLRETFEESGWRIAVDGVIGIYLWETDHQRTYLRVALSGSPIEQCGDCPLDDGIIATHWLTYQQIASGDYRLRSPLVLRCLDDQRAGHLYDLALLQHLPPGEASE
jgi:8-oxo-dGTP pyrophosphatase MutT (NUDIX family)